MGGGVKAHLCRQPYIQNTYNESRGLRMGAIIYQKRGNTNTLPNGQANSNKNKNQFKVTNLAVTPKLNTITD